MMTQNIKQELFNLCQDYLDKRIHAARQAIAYAQQSANEETKSSSGDKYETGRAMMQLDIEKNTQQLSESLKLKNALDQIQIGNPFLSVHPGCLVVTDSEAFFIAISLGKVTLHDRTYLVISPGSPLGKELLGLSVGDAMTFKDHTYVIQELK